MDDLEFANKANIEAARRFKAERDALAKTLALHAGDVMSLSNELDEWRDRALAAEAALALVGQQKQP